MSLVAYVDSDDGSSDSEAEESSLDAKTSATAIENVREAKHDSELMPSPSIEKRSKLSALLLPKPRKSPENTVIMKSEAQPKLWGLKSMGDIEDEDEIIEVEEEYVPLSQIKKNKETPTVRKTEKQKSVGSLFSRMPSPWSLGIGITLGTERGSSDDGDVGTRVKGSKKGKHPVRIAAPSIVKEDSDEEADEVEAVAAKRVKQSKSGSGLSSLLPKPKHSITLKASNRNKPSIKLSNRALIPHTLTKKPTSSKETKTKKKTDDGNISGDDDDDSEPVSFFSFADKKDVEPSITKGFAKPVMSASTSAAEQSLFSKSLTVTSVPDVSSDEHMAPVSGEELRADPCPAPYQDHQTGYDYASASDVSQYYDSSEPTTTYYQPVEDSSQPYAYGSYDQSSHTTYYDDDSQPSYSHHQEAEPNTEAEHIDVEKIKRLQGKGNRREEINIIDINAADQTSDTKLQITNLTADQFAHRSSKKKGSMPSSQQRRKHQITYLAFQAKEREFELQQQWSSNRQSKRQTQAKYGF